MFARFLIAATITASIGLCVFLCAKSAHAGSMSPSRHALVIGNAAYPDSDAALPSPRSDQKLLAEELRRRGFAVEAGEDLTRQAMQAAIDRFTRKVGPGSTALVFFGGYGIQVSRKNYIIPVDARIWSEADVLRDGISVDAILNDLERKGAGARALILDASRRNPFERRFRSFSTGLAETKAAPGLLSLHSAATGSVVSESAPGPSAFIAELTRQIAMSELTAEQAFAACRDAVSRESRGQQSPALTSGLAEGFYFDATRRKPDGKIAQPRPEPPKAESPKAESPKAEPPKPDSAKADAAVRADAPETDIDALVVAEEDRARDFNKASAVGTKASLEDFLRRHPAGALSNVARADIARIESGPQVREPPPPPPAAALAPATPAAPAPAALAPPAPARPWRSPPKPYSMAELQRRSTLDARIARNARDGAAFYERGQFHAQRDDYPAAIADFDQAIRLDPTNPEALNNRCWVRAISNDLQRALADCNEALRLRPVFVDALDSRGFVNLKLGALSAAVADYDSALGVNPVHSSALYGRGIAKSRLGQSAQARDDLTGALALNPMIDRDFAQYGLR